MYAEPLAAGVPLVVTDPANAELAKVVANAFLATKISFINAMAELCEAVQADVVHLAEALGHHPRIGHRGPRPGLGFGGGSLPEDVREFQPGPGSSGPRVRCASSRTWTRSTSGAGPGLSRACDLFGGSVAGRTVGVLGAAFKPDPDDIRDSPALAVAARLGQLGARVSVFDPAVMDRARRAHPVLSYAGSVQGAARDADLVLLLTEWPEISDTDPEVLGKTVAQRWIIDARNSLDAQRWRAAGWRYRALGRG